MNKLNYYEAKFQRDKKEHPMEWIITPNGDGTFRLAHAFAIASEAEYIRCKI